ncbi:MAG: hypothetical protein K8R69_00755 [Deltaproteobacteria bacterium]|nr:hypothetical protein [Deltaproteobacteria bacterium]
MKSTRILSMFSTIVALCGLFACSQGAQNDADILSQLEKSGKVESPASTAAAPSTFVPSAPVPDNESGDGDAFFRSASRADDSIDLRSPASAPQIPDAATNPPPPPPPAPLEQNGTAQQNIPSRPCKGGGLDGCPSETAGDQLLNPYAVDSISISTIPSKAPKFDTVTIDPNFIDRVAPMTIGQYCEDKFNECTQGATGAAGISVCSGAFNYCMDPGNCAPRKEVCFLNHKNNCFHDAEVCFLEDLCRKKKVACVTDTQAPTECEGNRMACNSHIEERLASCVSTKDQCLKDGGGTQECYWDYESCKKSLGS